MNNYNFNKNYKILLSKIKEYPNKCRDILYSQVVNLYIGKILVFSQIDLQIQSNFNQNPSRFFWWKLIS